MADEIENGMEIDDPEISDNTAYYIESTIVRFIVIVITTERY